MQAEEMGIPPDAADKLKVLQLFHESVPRAQVRIERVQRIVGPIAWAQFLCGTNLDGLEIGYYTPAGPSQLARLCESGFCEDDFEEMHGDRTGIPVSHSASTAYDRVCGQFNLLGSSSGRQSGTSERCLCVVFCAPQALRDCPMVVAPQSSPRASNKEYCVSEPAQLLLAYVLELSAV